MTRRPVPRHPAADAGLATGYAAADAAAKTALGDAKPAFDAAWDRWDRQRDAEGAVAAYRTARDEWIGVVLRDVLGQRAVVGAGRSGHPQRCRQLPDTRVQAVASGAIRHDERIGALVWVIDPVSSLHDQGTDGWAASPVDRMEAMLRAGRLPIGVVTDGRWWAIVSATPAGLAAPGVFDAQTWIEEPATRNAWWRCSSVAHLVGGREDERLPALFAESVLAAEEITEALGVQGAQGGRTGRPGLRRRVAEARDRGEPDPLPDDGEVIYEAVVTVLMRVVFLLFAQERDLLPQGELFASGYGLVGQLDALDERLRHEDDTALDATHLTWHRLLATSQALYRGASFEDMRLPAYGGSLFDPDRFPFLQAITERGTLALAVSDLVMLEVLEAVQQTARGRGRTPDESRSATSMSSRSATSTRACSAIAASALMSRPWGSSVATAPSPRSHSTPSMSSSRAPAQMAQWPRRSSTGPSRTNRPASHPPRQPWSRRWPRATRWTTPSAPCSR